MPMGGYTVIDLHVLRSLPAMDAARELAGYNRSELLTIVQLLNLRAKRNHERIDLMEIIMRATHPEPPAKLARPAAQQLGLFE